MVASGTRQQLERGEGWPSLCAVPGAWQPQGGQRRAPGTGRFPGSEGAVASAP